MIGVGNGPGTQAIELRLEDKTKALEVRFLRIGKPVGILGQDGLVAGLGFRLTLRGEAGIAGRKLRGR